MESRSADVGRTKTAFLAGGPKGGKQWDLDPFAECPMFIDFPLVCDGCGYLRARYRFSSLLPSGDAIYAHESTGWVYG